MNKLFGSKSPKKSKKSPTSDDEDQIPAPKEHTTTHRSRSPLKKSSSSRSSKAKEEGGRKAEPGAASPRNSRTFPSKSNSPRHPFDPATSHPLNDPDQWRRFSTRSNMSDSDRMDVDSEPQAAPTSPPPQSKMPGSFEAPKPAANGTNGATSSHAEGPVPPPHKSNPSSPVAPAAPTPEEAEAFKAAGNKFYKAKDYKKAIEEYTKGIAENMYNKAICTDSFCSCGSTTSGSYISQQSRRSIYFQQPIPISAR